MAPQLTADRSDLYRAGAGARERSARSARALLYAEDLRFTIPPSAEEAVRLFADELRARLRRDKDAVLLIWGEPGSGKSTLALHIAQLVDETFTPSALPRRVAFRPHHVAGLYDSAPQYGAAIIDEAASAGLLSTESPFSPTQKRLVELVSIIRARNVLLIILIPDPDLLAKTFRARRADYRIECQPIGPDGRASAYLGAKVRQRHFFLSDGKWLGFSDAEHGVPLAWPDYRTSNDHRERAIWDAYYPLKVQFLGQRTKEIQREMKRESDRGSGGDD